MPPITLPRKSLLRLLALAAALTLLFLLRSVWIALAAQLFWAYLLMGAALPLCRLLERRLSPSLAATGAFALLALLGAGLLLLFAPITGETVVALLCAVVVVCCFDLCARPAARLAVAAYMAAALVMPSFLLFLPLVAYVLLDEGHAIVRFSWIVPLAFSLRFGDCFLTAAVTLLCAAAAVMAWRTSRMACERARYRRLRDDQQEASLALAQKNRDLLAAQDYEVRLATLTERGRIAREIHDNVGHLLTRSIMQVEALQVVHADDEQVRDELEAVGETLHEAMGTVRASVHDLHDDAFDLRAQLQRAIAACGLPDVRLTFDARDVPLPVAYGLLSVVREALSNVAKHSDATRVDVSVIEYPALYQLVVQDNGTTAAGSGDASASSRGIGLHTMEERIGALGGRLRAEHRKGFRVFASIPKKQQGEDGK